MQLRMNVMTFPSCTTNQSARADESARHCSAYAQVASARQQGNANFLAIA